MLYLEILSDVSSLGLLHCDLFISTANTKISKK